jgi:RNA polymerase sigma factor (TIGR02999 family)
MSEVTRILSAIENGDPKASEELLPLVYDQLRRLAAQQMAREKSGQTLDATGLVHEAYLRLVGNKTPQQWNGRGHFFAAAAEAMRRILVEQARRRRSLKRGGAMACHALKKVEIASRPVDELLAINDSLDKLSATDPRAAELVKLRYFARFTIPEAAEILGISARTADNLWTYARAWLAVELASSD